jgi:hypothetical protein
MSQHASLTPLSQIPADYQATFRATLQRELAEKGNDLSDRDILYYLRQRQGDFKRGNYVDPAGGLGVVSLDPAEKYKGGVGFLLASGQGEQAQREKRQTWLKIIGFVGVTILFLIFALRGRNQRLAEANTPTETPQIVTPISGAILPPPTVSLPDLSDGDNALQTIGGLGGALSLGRPSALELHYRANEDVIALPIDPSRTTNRGELRYEEGVMLSDNPVAVWLFGTVLNYGIGIPDTLVRSLQVGDKILLSTDTGSTIPFVISERWQGKSYEATRLLSQDKIGMTLFALPAVSEEDVSLAFAVYDMTVANHAGISESQLGDTIAWGGNNQFQVTHIRYDEQQNGEWLATVQGHISPQIDTTLLFTLVTPDQQTPAIPLTWVDENAGIWQLVFSLSLYPSQTPIWLNWRDTQSQDNGQVTLGDFPDVSQAITVTLTIAILDTTTLPRSIEVMAVIQNNQDGDRWLRPNQIHITPEGGDALESPNVVTQPPLPVKLASGTTQTVTVSFPAPSLPLFINIAADRWTLSSDQPP